MIPREGGHTNPLVRHVGAFTDALGVENAPVILGLAAAPWQSDEQRDQFIQHLIGGRGNQPGTGLAPAWDSQRELYPMPRMDGNRSLDKFTNPDGPEKGDVGRPWATIPAPQRGNTIDA